MAKFNGWIVGRSLTNEEADALEPFLDLLTEVLEARRKFVAEPLIADPGELFQQAKYAVEKHELLIEVGVDQDYSRLRDEYVALATLALMHVENLDAATKAKQVTNGG